MPVLVSGSVATDFLMSFPGRFAELIVEDQLQRLSLSFLVEDLETRRGGVGANVAFGMAQLGLRPTLVAAVGHDFDDYRAWLDRHGVDTASVHVTPDKHTARFHCTTDADQNQIASFYPGAMEDARAIELGPVVSRLGGVDLVVISPNDPIAMLRHTEEARDAGWPFVADPSQQLASLDGEQIRRLVEGAAYLVTNDYERTLLESKTGWTADEVLERVEVRVTTRGGEGCVIERAGHDPIELEAFPETTRVDPTGVGDAFRAGFLTARLWGLGLAGSAEVGGLVATLALESVGTQEYEIDPERFVGRLREERGDTLADEVAGRLGVS